MGGLLSSGTTLAPEVSDRTRWHTDPARLAGMRLSGAVISSRTPRVIATDLDRTLLRTDGTTSERTRAALALAAAHGVHVLAVTARPTRWMDRLVPQFGTVLPQVIAANGAVCYDLAERRSYDARPFDGAVLPGLLGRLRAALPGAGIALETATGLVRETAYVPSVFDGDDTDPGRRVCAFEELLAGVGGEPVLKMIVAQRERPSADMFAEAEPAVGTVAHVTYSTNGGLLEVGPPAVTKASTLAAWCAARGIAAGDVAAFGDMPNDLPMLRWAGRSYAVANAAPDVLAAAGQITGSNDEDGVAAVIEGFFD
jgi:Cof subfamily protein (haloacid dehalogenase superfamily)